MHPLPVVIPPLGPTNHNHHYIADYARGVPESSYKPLDCVWNVMAHAQKPDFVFRRNGRVHLNRRGRQFVRLLAGELCTSVCRVCTARASLCSAVMWRLLATHSFRQFPLYFSPCASMCAITFQTQSTTRRRFSVNITEKETAGLGLYITAIILS
jgi:hypothetical protein